MPRPYTYKQLKERMIQEFGIPDHLIAKKEMQLAIRLYKISEDMNRYGYFKTSNDLYSVRASFIREILDRSYRNTERDMVIKNGQY